MPCRIFTITTRVSRIRETNNSQKNCYTCKIKIKVGDSVVTKLGSYKGTRLIRHEKCARRVNLIA